MLFGILLNSCDLLNRASEEPIDDGVLPNAVVGKPYYVEIATAEKVFFFNEKIEEEDFGLKWEYTSKYKDPNSEEFSDTISIYGTPTKAGNIIIYARSYTIKNDFIKPHIDISPIYKKFHINVLEEEPTYE